MVPVTGSVAEARAEAQKRCVGWRGERNSSAGAAGKISEPAVNAPALPTDVPSSILSPSTWVTDAAYPKRCKLPAFSTLLLEEMSGNKSEGEKSSSGAETVIARFVIDS